ncbi:hypothetical protein KUV85_17265 [Nocardioides panacisoli]|uniref:hypothetical protein n=1 Tax=Nocardioides panacisoli TaxID=627624 RepID=UPI001C62A2FB|nr:hypothetical protein [Nocardioides panacisoli]QYJ04049.1 hypothetical protein KUV85_17265 [Nocardioides panacisoli]
MRTSMTPTAPTAQRRLRRALWRAGIIPAILVLVVLGKVVVMMSHDDEGRTAFADASFVEAAEEFAENRSWNWFEPWVAPFDEGAARHANQQYPLAIEHYEVALQTVPTVEECTVRINLALAHEALGDRAADGSPPDRQEATARWQAGIDALAEGGCPQESGRGQEQTEQAQDVDERLRQKLEQQDQQDDDQQQQQQDDQPQQQSPQEQELEDRNDEGREDRRDQQEERDQQNQPGSGDGEGDPGSTPPPSW